MIDVSIILPVFNAEKWLDECLNSLVIQTFNGCMELSIFNDASTDESLEIIEKYRTKLAERDIRMVLAGHKNESPKGVGYAKNRAVEQSCGDFLCFLDADDVMDKRRVELQYKEAKERPNSIIGSCFVRRPVDSTERYTKWANEISHDQLYTQVYTSHGPTVLMPTWFCKRDVYLRVGLFDESGKGCPEDLLFFYEHLRKGGGLYRVDENLLTYRYHQEAASFSVHEDTIWKHRVDFFQERVLSKWTRFTIWNAGKQGRKFFRSLTTENQKKVRMFCDVDAKKIAKGCYTYEDSNEKPKPRIPIVHYQNAEPPFVICVKQDLTGGVFEEILSSLNLKEGVDFYHCG